MNHKRPRLSPDNIDSQPPTLHSAASTLSNTTASTAHSASASSSFRNVSACNRCRIRKNRCDQHLPACTPCEKAGARCVGFDPALKREIPRTYVFFLESRVNYLEDLLSSHHVPYEAPSSDFDLGSKNIVDHASSISSPSAVSNASTLPSGRARSYHTEPGSDSGSEWEQKEQTDKINKLVSNIGMVSVQGASDPRYLGSTSGISFARVVFAAVKCSVNDKANGRKSKTSSVGAAAAMNNASMRDSFFGLQSKPTIKPAPFPDRELGLKLVNLYFEHANPQIPILHRPEFMKMFTRAYASTDRQRSARELYMLNIVFAIGAGIILEEPKMGESANSTKVNHEPVSPTLKRMKAAGLQRQPEEYHASAMMHLESFLGTMPTGDRPDAFGGGLEQLQAVLLLASFALLRPVAPGLWYIIGVAMRLGVDLGLHFEDGTDSDKATTGASVKESGHIDWIRDLRRRLWWCVYSLDRLVSTCVGRPFGITDQVVTTNWPSILDDEDITPTGFLISSESFNGPSYKRVSHHYFRLRLLQSEILQVIQWRQAKRVYQKDRSSGNQYMHTMLSSSFLQPFGGSFHAWRTDIDRRLWEWKESAPLQEDISVQFSVRFLELNYWQAVIMLYRQSLSVPAEMAGENGPHHDVEIPLSPHADDHEDEEDIFLKVAEAGQRVLKLYRQLHRIHLVNYTYLATVHLFMAGIAFLYSVWHSPTVRARLTLEDVDFTILAGTSVLSDLVDKCPPAEACRDAFDRMSKATVKMCQQSNGFGSQVRFTRTRELDKSPLLVQSLERQQAQQPHLTSDSSMTPAADARPPPTFDYNLRDLFPANTAHPRSSYGSNNVGGYYPVVTRPYAQNSRPTSSFLPTSTPGGPSAFPQHQTSPTSLQQSPNAPTPVGGQQQAYDPGLIPPPSSSSSALHSPSTTSSPHTGSNYQDQTPTGDGNSSSSYDPAYSRVPPSITSPDFDFDFLMNDQNHHHHHHNRPFFPSSSPSSSTFTGDSPAAAYNFGGSWSGIVGADSTATVFASGGGGEYNTGNFYAGIDPTTAAADGYSTVSGGGAAQMPDLFGDFFFGGSGGLAAASSSSSTGVGAGAAGPWAPNQADGDETGQDGYGASGSRMDMAIGMEMGFDGGGGGQVVPP